MGNDSTSAGLRTDSAGLRPGGWQFPLPSWAISAVFHVAVLLTLGLLMRFTPEGAAKEPLREAGVVLKPRAETDYYEGEEDAAQTDAAAEAVENAAGASPLPSESPVDARPELTETLNVIGPGGGEGSPLLGAGGFLDGPGANRNVTGGKARTSVFGIEGEGYQFIYVFDRSGSMGGGRRSALAAAKAQLLASLESLERTHQFQIIFYNDYPTIFDLSGRGGSLVFADERSKELAGRFVSGIEAKGATRHEDALMKALKLRPDVVFYLTDADQPVLSPGQIQRITRYNAGRTSINAIEFGIGPTSGEDNFLKQVARLNGGKHTYVDLTRLRRR